MSLKDDVEKLKKDLKKQELNEFKLADKKVRKKKVPFKFRARRFYKDGKVLVVWLGSNHHLDFKWGKIEGGLIKVLVRDEVVSYNSYEDGAVYFHKRYPVVVIPEWRIAPVNDSTEAAIDNFRSKSFGGKVDKDLAKSLGLASDAQQTIIRAIKSEEISKDDGLKKKKKLPVGVMVLLIGLLLFIVGKAFGVV